MRYGHCSTLSAEFRGMGQPFLNLDRNSQFYLESPPFDEATARILVPFACAL